MLINPPGKKGEFGLTSSGSLAPARGDGDGENLKGDNRSCSEGCLELEETCPETPKIPDKQKEQSWKWKLRIKLSRALWMLGFAHMIHSLLASGLEQTAERCIVPEPQGCS